MGKERRKIIQAGSLWMAVQYTAIRGGNQGQRREAKAQISSPARESLNAKLSWQKLMLTLAYEEGGQLTEAVRRRPYSVVLFDEIEKAHPDVFNVLLQVLDDGRITDSQGRTVDFKNTILIMTSNIGAHYLLEGIREDGEIEEKAKEAVMAELKLHFRPEFLNRLDETILFRPLTKDSIGKIIHLIMEELNERLKEREVTLGISTAAEELIVEEGYDPVYGARPLKRYMQKHVETLAARLLLADEVRAGDQIWIDVDAGSGKLTASVKGR